MTTASAAVPASLSPLTFLAGVALFALAVAALAAAYGAARYFRAAHRAGVARVAAYDARTVEARRRARRNARTIIDAKTGAVIVEARRTR